MSIMDMLIRIAEETPRPEPVTHYTVTPFPRCAKCRDVDVANDGDFCEQCTREKLQGYEVLTMTGRCANGFQLDGGTLYHAVKFGERKAVCGAVHGKRSRWSEYHGEAVTCPRCNKKLAR